MPTDEVNELQKEWRAIVLDKLNALEQGQKELKTDIIDVKTTFVKQQSLESLRESQRIEIAVLREKIEKLDYFKAKVMGMAIAAQVILAVVVKFLFK